MSSQGFSIPPRHSDFKWLGYHTARRTVDEVIRRYDSSEELESIIRDLEAQDRAKRWVVEGILYEARPQRLIALLIDDSHIEVGPLDPATRTRVIKWKTRRIDGSEAWEGEHGGYIIGEGPTNGVIDAPVRR
jgi:hypothetical protein